MLSSRPARIVADVANEPVASPPQILDAASAPLLRPEIEHALFPAAPQEPQPLLFGGVSAAKRLLRMEPAP